MSTPQTTDELRQARCVPCEGGVPKLTADEIERQLRLVDGWGVLHDPDRIRRTWTVKNFVAGMKFFEKVAAVAESEGHHPDLHLHGYRNVDIEIWTHAIGGLSLNDFILAARIDDLTVETA
ncbi:MAG: 4a-hydroxytetrahydrobiopterin dehydratase [Planctomycetaceae bacterium]|jgi:4a-hydroxytetrahydrobiopterin dehydratase